MKTMTTRTTTITATMVTTTATMRMMVKMVLINGLPEATADSCRSPGDPACRQKAAIWVTWGYAATWGYLGLANATRGDLACYY